MSFENQQHNHLNNENAYNKHPRHHIFFSAFLSKSKIISSIPAEPPSKDTSSRSHLSARLRYVYTKADLSDRPMHLLHLPPTNNIPIFQILSFFLCYLSGKEFYTITNLQGSQTTSISLAKYWKFYTITNLQGSQTMPIVKWSYGKI